MKDFVSILVLGFLPGSKVDLKQARKILRAALNQVEVVLPARHYELASLLVDDGIMALAYREGRKRDYRLVGYAGYNATDMKKFPVHSAQFVGKGWDDATQALLDRVGSPVFSLAVINIGGDIAAMRATERALSSGAMVLYYPLDNGK